MATGKKKTAAKIPKDKLLARLTMFFFNKPMIAAILWLVLTIFGAVSYTTLLKREGFPSVSIPITVVSGAYFVNDSAKVDKDVAGPISEIALKDSRTKTVSAQSSTNFFGIQVQYAEGTDAKAAAEDLKRQVAESDTVPKDLQAQYLVPYFGATGGDTEQIDAAISFYSENDSTSTQDLLAKANAAKEFLTNKKIANVSSLTVKDPNEQVTDPSTGKSITIQRNFDRYGKRENGETSYHRSVIIAVAKTEGADVIKLDNNIRNALEDLHNSDEFKGYESEISASFAPSIKENLSELQRVLLEGLIAVLVVGSIVIAIRASIITVVSMITVLVIAIGLLYVIGYTLNVITLFALILGLALIVDDTIIMVEAIDAARAHQKDPQKIVREATRKISRAMVAATLTASLSFAPLLFVGGVLGSFIRAIPVTIIASLIISLFVALIFIPFFARILLLGKKQLGKEGVKEVAAGFERRLAEFLAGPMLWARNSKKRLFGVGGAAVFIGMAFLFAGIFIAKDVVFNIFPPTKDTNGLIIMMNFPQGLSITQAEELAAKADKIALEEIGPEFVQSSYYSTGDNSGATESIELTSYSKREVTSQQLAKKLQDRFNTDLKEASVVVGQSDVGPPSSSFVIQLDASKRTEAFKVADQLAAYLKTVELKRPSGKVAKFINVSESNPGQYVRSNGKPIITVSAGFDGNDTTTLVSLAQDAVKKEFTASKLEQNGLDGSALSFDLGQESENQDSFKTLALAFPILMFVIFILLAIQFRSLLQPLLIFLAIPFSIFGVMLGLRITNNAISFFTMLGFFALIGLSIKNTILLTDFANQSRRAGMSAIDSAVAALEERFRPLFATSMTAVVSLIPLALSSPFWQGLAVVLIFGLLSSTLLVLTVFPYYFLGTEYLRIHISARQFFTWAVITGVAGYLLSMLTNFKIALLVIPLSFVYMLFQRFYIKLLNPRK